MCRGVHPVPIFVDATFFLVLLQPQAKGATGAGAAIAVVDLRKGQVYAATVGGCLCLVARSVGSFQRATTEFDAVADGRGARPELHGLRGNAAPGSAELERAREHLLGFSVGSIADTYARTKNIKGFQVKEDCPLVQVQVSLG